MLLFPVAVEKTLRDRTDLAQIKKRLPIVYHRASLLLRIGSPQLPQ
jgi:hypothetical protein